MNKLNTLKLKQESLAERIKFFEDDKLSLQSDLKSEREKSEKLNSENSSLKSDYYKSSNKTNRTKR